MILFETITTVFQNEISVIGVSKEPSMLLAYLV